MRIVLPLVVAATLMISACQTSNGGGGILANADPALALANSNDVASFAKVRFVDHTTGLSKVMGSANELKGQTYQRVQKDVASAAGGIAAFHRDFAAFCAKQNGRYAYGICSAGDRILFIVDIFSTQSQRKPSMVHDFVGVDLFVNTGTDNEAFLAEVAPLSLMLKPVRFAQPKTKATKELFAQYDALAAQMTGSPVLSRLVETERQQIARGIHEALTNPEGRSGWLMVEAVGGNIRAGERYNRGGNNCRDVTIQRIVDKTPSLIGELATIMSGAKDQNNWTIKHTLCQPASSDLTGWQITA
ncbi:hypothetical protein CRT60_26760 [Azospirillum palustre]|uniref:Lipoprotein n=1 Tax=Azospirillum palustre TaxID=2044885 RepID=A0A2B8B459_9PROT|nr:hypothetical protein [Azospirillum palustre]PGH53486.1 hypothetical protein CRT60_26760 [Azospirillum palustre]